MGLSQRARQAWTSFRESLLFVPTWMILGAILLAGVTSYLDTRHQDALVDVTDRFGDVTSLLIFAGGPESAGRLLAAVAGTWATIAGVVYSVTLVTIQLSATKYSAQVIPIFERDRLNQVVLGIFTGTFAYALLVLKTVREANGQFVPVVGVNVAILLALVSLGFLIGFIGNLTAYIRPTRFVEDYATRGLDLLREQREPGEGYEPLRQTDWDPTRVFATLPADEPGYLREVDWAALRVAIGRLPDEVRGVELVPAIGDRVTRREPLWRVHGIREVPRDARDALRETLGLGSTRDEDDPVHVVETLADVGETAMSGGATDVGVAMTSLRELVRFTSAALECPERPALFRLAARGGRQVVLVRLSEQYHQVAMRAMSRVLDKACREGYWEVAEVFCTRSTLFFQRAAQSDHHGTWADALDWFRTTAPAMLALPNRRARLRMVEGLRRSVEELRRDGSHVHALDLEQALVECAREAQVEPEVLAAARGS